MSEQDAAEEILERVERSLLRPGNDEGSRMFNKGIKAMRDALPDALEDRGFRIVHAGAVDALMAIISDLRQTLEELERRDQTPRS